MLGLVPGAGDIASSLISMLIVMRAVRAGVPRIAVARMVANIAFDTVVGSVPLAGDLFDFAYKSNLARRSGPLGDAGWIVDVEGKPVQLWGRGPDEPFTLNDAAMDNDHQLWEILQKERQQLGVQNL